MTSLRLVPAMCDSSIIGEVRGRHAGDHPDLVALFADTTKPDTVTPNIMKESE